MQRNKTYYILLKLLTTFCRYACKHDLHGQRMRKCYDVAKWFYQNKVGRAT